MRSLIQVYVVELPVTAQSLFFPLITTPIPKINQLTAVKWNYYNPLTRKMHTATSYPRHRNVIPQIQKSRAP